MKKLFLLITILSLGMHIIFASEHDYEIVDYNASRDKSDVELMFSNDWQWLGMDSSVDLHVIEKLNLEWESIKVVRTKEKTVGFVSYNYPSRVFKENRHDFQCGIIYYLVVDKNYRNRGYASQLLKVAIDEMIENQVNKVTLRVHKENITALALYENKCGFQIEHDPYVDLKLNLDKN